MGCSVWTGRHPVLFGAWCLVVLASPLSAQSIRGRLVEGETGQPVSGALISLLDSEDEAVATTMSAADGEYLLRAPSGGAYRVRTDRIGFESSLTEWIEIQDDQAVSFQVQVDMRPVELASLAVEARRENRCSRTPEAGAAIYALWAEARKALENAVWADSALKFRFAGERLTQFIDSDGDPIPIRPTSGTPGIEVKDAPPPDSVITLTRTGYELFRSLPAEDLREIGYVVVVTNELDRKHLLTYGLTTGGESAEPGAVSASNWVAFFGPDARVLLSEVFHETHCFRIAEDDEDNPGLVGLAFKPVERRKVDIEGVLWLNQESAELRFVDFRYVGDLPGSRGARCTSPVASESATCRNALQDARHWPSTGRIEFDRLASGPFIVRSWWIQVPGVRMGNPLVDRIGVWTREGGRVTRVLPPKGN